MTLGCNHPMGPLALADLIGLDVLLAVMQTIHDEFGDPKYRSCPLLRETVAAGYLGRQRAVVSTGTDVVVRTVLTTAHRN